MGTSRNDRSPNIPPWRPALAILGKTNTTPEQQIREIWRAAAADRGEKLLRDFSHEALANACKLVAQRSSLAAGLNAYDASTIHASDGGLAIEMGRRALARCLASKSSPTQFVGELFSEAVSYYCSRDLPSFVAAPGRIQSTSSAIKLKAELRKLTRESVKELGPPKYTGHAWKGYIDKVLKQLQHQQVQR